MRAAHQGNKHAQKRVADYIRNNVGLPQDLQNPYLRSITPQKPSQPPTKPKPTGNAAGGSATAAEASLAPAAAAAAAASAGAAAPRRGRRGRRNRSSCRRSSHPTKRWRTKNSL